MERAGESEYERKIVASDVQIRYDAKSHPASRRHPIALHSLATFPRPRGRNAPNTIDRQTGIQSTMSRVLTVATSAALLLIASADVRGDILIGTIDFMGPTPLGISRYDDTLQNNPATLLSAGGVDPFSIPTDTLALPIKPSDVVVSPNGDIYATDLTGKIIRVDGQTREPIPSPSAPFEDGVFTGYLTDFDENLTYASLNFGPNGNLYVVDSYDTDSDHSTLTPGVRVFDVDTGNQVDTLFDNLGSGVTGLSALLSSVAFTPQGNLLLSDLGGGIIYHADLSGGSGAEIVTELVSGIDIDGNPGPDLFNPSGMAIDAFGTIYVANMSGNSVVKFNADGSGAELVATIRPDDPATVPSTLFSAPGFSTFTHHPTDITFDQYGNLLVTVLGDLPVTYEDEVLQPTNGAVFRYDTSGNLLQVVGDDLLPVSGIDIIADLLPGDYDGNGRVETDDYLEWKSQFGSTVQPTTGADGNGDGVVNLADYTVWRDSLGASGIQGAASADPFYSDPLTAVPEPSSVVMLSMALAGTAVWCRRALTA